MAMYVANEKEFSGIESVLDFCRFDVDRSVVSEMYDEMLDEYYPATEIDGAAYFASQIQKALDPEAYRIDVDLYLDFQIDDARYDLEKGENTNVCGIDITIVNK